MAMELSKVVIFHLRNYIQSMAISAARSITLRLISQLSGRPVRVVATGARSGGTHKELEHRFTATRTGAHATRSGESPYQATRVPRPDPPAHCRDLVAAHSSFHSDTERPCCGSTLYSQNESIYRHRVTRGCSPM